MNTELLVVLVIFGGGMVYSIGLYSLEWVMEKVAVWFEENELP